MKRTPLKRKTPLRSTTGFKPRTTPLRKKTTLRHLEGKKGHKKPQLTKLKKQLWELCKQITRKRYGNTCYTSGKTGLEGSNWQTGHFIPSSLCSTELRYDLKNLRPQSYKENINHSGNTLQFRRNLIRDHGIEYVEELEQRNEATKGLMYREQYYLDKIAEYKSILLSTD